MNSKVLIIDDEESIRSVLIRAISSLGYDVKAAADGHTGISLCNEWNPDIILTDIFMPEQDGLEIIRSLRKTLPGVPIIAMSGGGNMGHLDVLRTARAMGAVNNLSKPFEISDLKDALESAAETDRK